MANLWMDQSRINVNHEQGMEYYLQGIVAKVLFLRFQKGLITVLNEIVQITEFMFP